MYTSYLPQENDVREHVVPVLLDLLRPLRGPLREVLSHQAPPDQVGQEVAEGGARGGAEADLGGRNKNRLGSTTCGEDLQKIFKDWQSFKGQRTLSKSTKKIHRFQAISVVDLF